MPEPPTISNRASVLVSARAFSWEDNVTEIVIDSVLPALAVAYWKSLRKRCFPAAANEGISTLPIAHGGKLRAQRQASNAPDSLTAKSAKQKRHILCNCSIEILEVADDRAT